MAQERPKRIAEWVTLLRQNAPIAREQLKSWFSEVRAEPRLIWETIWFRFAAYAIIGVLAAWGVVYFVSILAPPPPPGARDPAVTADYHIVCAQPACGYNFVIQREFGFDDFPVMCDRCKKETGMPGRRCYSVTCQGRWVAPQRVDDKLKCPQCGAFFPEQP